MIEPHVFNTFLLPELKQTGSFGVVTFINGLIRITSYNVCYTKLLRIILVTLSSAKTLPLHTHPTPEEHGGRHPSQHGVF